MLTWRIYRDRNAATVPLLRRKGGTVRVRYESVRPFTGDRLVVGDFDRATGLYTGRQFTASDELPAAALAEEPILLEGASPRCAVPIRTASGDLSVRGDGPNPYLEPRIIHDEGEALLFAPGSRIRRERGTKLVVADELGRGVYRVPAGYVASPVSVRLGGGREATSYQYDAYHGTLLILDEEGAPLPGAFVTAELQSEERIYRRLSSVKRGVHALVDAGGGHLRLEEIEREPHQAIVYGFVLIGEDPSFEDTRRRAAAVWDADVAHRIGSGHLDAGPISHGHLYVVASDAPSERIARAVRESLPAGSIVRVVPLGDVPTSGADISESSDYILTEDGAVISTEDSRLIER